MPTFQCLDGTAHIIYHAVKPKGPKLHKLISLRDSRRGDSRQNKIGPRDVEIRVRSVRFTPKGFEKKVKGNFVIFRSVVTWAWWLVFEEPVCGGWFLVIYAVLAGF